MLHYLDIIGKLDISPENQSLYHEHGKKNLKLGSSNKVSGRSLRKGGRLKDLLSLYFFHLFPLFFYCNT